MISLRTALILYGLLAAFALATLKGKMLALALVIVAAIALKSVLYELKKKT
jgi:hypothetical protein